MEKRLFLTGVSGRGKSTMIENALGASLVNAGGFITRRVLRGDGSLEGFDLYPAAAAAGVDGFEPSRFLDYTVTPPTHDNEVFRGVAVRLLEEAQYYSFAVLDEIGGFEMLIPQFRAALGNFFNAGVPCIGVLKGSKNASELRRSFGLGDRYDAQLTNLRKVLEADADTLILEISGWDDKRALDAVQKWVSEYAK